MGSISFLYSMESKDEQRMMNENDSESEKNECGKKSEGASFLDVCVNVRMRATRTIEWSFVHEKLEQRKIKTKKNHTKKGGSLAGYTAAWNSPRSARDHCAANRYD